MRPWRKAGDMNTHNILKLNGALFAFLILSLAVSAQAQSALRTSHGIQEEERESSDHQRSPGDDTTRRLLFWNGIALNANALDHALARPDQGGPLRTARAFAIVHIAMFDAFNAIVGGYKSYTGLDPATSDEDFDCDRSRASVDAAIAQAAGDTLIALYPFQAKVIEAIQRVDLKRIPNGSAKAAGIRIGRRAASEILSKRSNDGSRESDLPYNVPGGFIPNSTPGKWVQDPISKTPIALGALWNRVPPFVILSAGQFSVAPPPDLTSKEYRMAFDEVKRLGGDGITSPTIRTADQTWESEFHSTFPVVYGRPLRVRGRSLPDTAQILSDRRDRLQLCFGRVQRNNARQSGKCAPAYSPQIQIAF
jgi:Vanadium chloroperoxidase N-terminal domain